MNVFKIKVNQISLLISLIVLRLLEEFLYVNALVPIWNEYGGYVCDLELTRYVYSWCLYLILGMTLKVHLKYISFVHTSYALLFIVTFLPTCIMMGYKETSFIIPLSIYWIMLSICAIKLPSFSLCMSIKKSMKLIYAIMAILSITAIYCWGFYAGFRIHLDLIDVYGIRRESAGYNLTIMLKYIFPLIPHIVPILIMWMLEKKKYVFAVFLVMVQMLCFFYNGSKSTYVAVILAVGFYFLINKGWMKIKSLLIYFIALLVCLIGELALTEGTPIIISLIFRRAMFVPAALNYNYVDFFAEHAYNLYSNIIKVGTPVYPNGLALEIGTFMGYPEMAANNGLFSDAYANLGIIGCFVMPVLVIFVLKLLDYAARDVSEAIIMTPILTTTMTFISSSFFTCLVTHGVIMTALVLYLLPRKKETNSVQIEGIRCVGH